MSPKSPFSKLNNHAGLSVLYSRCDLCAGHAQSLLLQTSSHTYLVPVCSSTWHCMYSAPLAHSKMSKAEIRSIRFRKEHSELFSKRKILEYSANSIHPYRKSATVSWYPTLTQQSTRSCSWISFQIELKGRELVRGSGAYTHGPGLQ